MAKRLTLLIIGGLFLLGLWVGASQLRPAARRPPPTASAQVILVTRSPAATPTIVPSPTPTAGPQRVVVSGTGGVGLRLREGPGVSHPVVTVLAEGTPLWAFPESVEADGLRWRRVRTETGTWEGWAAEPYLAPAAP